MQLEWEKSRDQYEKKSRLNLQNNLRKASLGAFLFGSCNAERKNFFKGRRQCIHCEKTQTLRDLFFCQFHESDKISLPEVQWY